VIVSIILVCFITSCDDIFLKDISEDEVNILCPAEGYSTTSSDSILFWWEGLDGATSYEIQIASPDFENTSRLEYDATLDAVKFKRGIPKGGYQWRIRAINSGYESEYVIRNLYVTSK
jgi:hypothetical protein